MAPVVMPASWTRVRSARMWEPCTNCIRLGCICISGMVFATEHFMSQTQLWLDTGTVPSMLPLNDITDTFKVSSRVLLSRRPGWGSRPNSVGGPVTMSSADMWTVQIPEPRQWHTAQSIQPKYSRRHEPRWMQAMAHTDVVVGGTYMFMRVWRPK